MKQATNACVDIHPAGEIEGTLVCIPGVNSGAYIFTDAAVALPRWRIVAMNSPGVEGMPFNLPLTPRSYAEQVLDVLKAQHVEGPFVVLGHSMGGFAAQELARAVPDRVSKLVLVSTCRGQPDIGRDVMRMPLTVGTDFFSFQRKMTKNEDEGKKLFGHGFAEREPLRYNTFVAQVKAHMPGQTASLAQMAAGGMFTSVPWVKKLKIETLVVQGTDDVVVSPESAKKLSEALPHARYLELHGVGHFPMVEHPKFWAHVATFVGGTPLGEDVPAKPGWWRALWARLWRSG
jgi:pimeloyl-ACP methyl ester carboxylesterase